MRFTLAKWIHPDGDYTRVYVNHKYFEKLKMYFDSWAGEEVRMHFDASFYDFPKPFCYEADKVEAVRDAALRESGIDPDDFTWEELLEACA